MSRVNHLNQWIRSLRGDARERGGALTFSPLALFVLFGSLLREDELLEACLAAEGDGPCLDPDDDDQTTKLEEIMLDVLARHGLRMMELLTVEWEDADQLATTSLLLVTYDGHTILALYRPEHTPSFHAVATGDVCALHTLLAGTPELVLPRLATQRATIRDVRMFESVPWTAEDLRRVLATLIGASYPIEAVVGAARLNGSLDRISCGYSTSFGGT